ncbi:MAG: nitroreductase family deazaflavin-dependent oxidoreductase [Chloroflexi bacterium]|nr:nitroreductase family deazaflavin-dependent oxidoreductase [Chloroflexota bacterium]
MAAEPLTAPDDPAGPGDDASRGSRPAAGPARGTERVPALDDDLAADTRFARLRTRGRRTGETRLVTVGFVEEPDGSILVAAGAPDSAWARNLLIDPILEVVAGGRSFKGVAEVLDDRDPRRGRAVRELILRYGTPSEGLGSGPIFVIRPAGRG